MERLPWILVWLEWYLSMCWPSLITSITLVFCHKLYAEHRYSFAPYLSFPDITLVLFVGFSAWVVYCAFRYGYAVG